MAEESRTPTAWELLRAIEGTTKAIEGVREAMLTRDQFIEYQRGTDRRFEALEKRQAEWEAKSERAHGELHGEIDGVEVAMSTKVKAVEDLLDARDEKARDSRGRVWLAIGLLVAGILAPRVWEILRSTGATP
jgi:hypothetical protein